MTTGLSAILGNDPVILSGTAFLVYFIKVAEVSPTAWLFSEFASCNTASMLLFVGISNPKKNRTNRGKGIRRMLFFVRDLK